MIESVWVKINIIKRSIYFNRTVTLSVVLEFLIYSNRTVTICDLPNENQPSLYLVVFREIPI